MFTSALYMKVYFTSPPLLYYTLRAFQNQTFLLPFMLCRVPELIEMTEVVNVSIWIYYRCISSIIFYMFCFFFFCSQYMNRTYKNEAAGVWPMTKYRALWPLLVTPDILLMLSLWRINCSPQQQIGHVKVALVNMLLYKNSCTVWISCRCCCTDSQLWRME